MGIFAEYHLIIYQNDAAKIVLVKFLLFDMMFNKGGRAMRTLNDQVNSLKEDLIRETQAILRIKSVQEEAQPGKPFGSGIDQALKAALALAEKLGFSTINLDGYIGFAEYGAGEDYIGILGHLDVVPAGDGWNYPPYGAEIHEGRIYARGAVDDKGPTIAALFGLKAIKDLGLPLSKKVRIIFGTDEETGSREISRYLQTERPPLAGFTPDGQYPIIYAEKGLTIFDLEKELATPPSGPQEIKYIQGGQRANMVPDYAEAGIQTSDNPGLIKIAEEFAKKSGYDIQAEEKSGLVVVSSVGFGAHGSLPQLGKNAIMQLFAFLGSLPLGNSDLGDFIHFMNENAGFDVYGQSFGVGLSDQVSGRLSFNVGIVQMADGKIAMTLNLRYPVTLHLEDMMGPIEERLAGTGINIANFQHHRPLFFPADHPLIKTLESVYQSQTGQEATLLAIGGGTYAKAMPNIVAFGPIFPGQPDLDHQPNEFMSVEDLAANARMYAQAIYALAK